MLSPVGISVETDIAVTAEPPRADILLLRRDQPHWNKAQRQRLADGLRDTDAGHLLIEFKYSEGLTKSAFVATHFKAGQFDSGSAGVLAGPLRDRLNAPLAPGKANG